MILQLDPAILVDTPLGIGHALFIIDYGMHQNTCWVVAVQETGIIKHFDCNDVILCTNYTYGMNLSRNGLNIRIRKLTIIIPLPKWLNKKGMKKYRSKLKKDTLSQN